MNNKSEIPANLDRQIRDFGSWVDAQIDATPDIGWQRHSGVSHYTSAAGAMGIVTGNFVRLCEHWSMNDPSEIVFGFEAAKSVIKSYDQEELKAKRHNIARSAFVQIFPEGMDQWKQEFGVYFSSFSFKENDLDQWRLYADNGRGCEIRLSPSAFKPRPPQKDPSKNAVLVPVVYSTTALEERVRAGLTKLYPILDSASAMFESNVIDFEVLKEVLTRVSVDFSAYITFFSVMHKDPAYAREEEARLILVGRKQELRRKTQCFVRGALIVPYIPYTFAPALKSKSILPLLRVGPSSPHGAEFGLQALLDANGFSSTSVERSKIPYRAS